LAKIAEGLTDSCLTARALADGEGWAVDDVICTAGPEHRPFEEQRKHRQGQGVGRMGPRHLFCFRLFVDEYTPRDNRSSR